MPDALDDDVRAASFAWLNRQREAYGDEIPWKVLQGFSFRGRPIALITQRGIRYLSGQPALAFSTTYSSDPDRAPYADHVGLDGFPRYKYQGTDPNAPDNRAMKAAAREGKPVIWFVGVASGLYSATYPAYVLGHDDRQLEFTIGLDAEQRALANDESIGADEKRRYVERLTRLRLHQPIFRQRVLRAYETRCTICRLKHVTLLDAAHIISDAVGGRPVVTNGLTLCKIHHAAYDHDLLSVGPDHRVHVRPSVLQETDGPMLLHGLQETDGRAIELPKRTAERPDRNGLLQRHQRFLQLSA